MRPGFIGTGAITNLVIMGVWLIEKQMGKGNFIARSRAR